MSTIIITGGTGLIGQALTKALREKNHEVIIFTRRNENANSSNGVTYSTWNPEKEIIDHAALSRADVVVHLAGAGVAEKRWSQKRKQEIINSRVISSRFLVNALATIPNKISTVVSASAIGWYGPDTDVSLSKSGHRGFVETDPSYHDFLGQTCQQWEDSIRPVQNLGKKLVILRTGIVVSREGGACKEFIKPLRWGIATILGSGKQIISWIHIDDLVRMFIAAIENPAINGIYNAVAPKPVSNKTLIMAMAKARNKFFVPVPVPGFVLKLMLGEMSIEILKSATVSADKILQTGFHFQYPDINSAMKGFF